MANDVILPTVLEVLAAAEKTFKQFDIDFYLVGA